MFNPKLSRRQLLKAGARSAVLALVGSGGGSGASGSDAEITSAAIHPAIGIARIGNSTRDYYLGVELPGTVPLAPGGFKHASGAIKRQAARWWVLRCSNWSLLSTEATLAGGWALSCWPCWLPWA